MARRRNYYDDYFYFTPTHPIETKDGIKARSQRGAFTKNWWAQRWIAALERLVDSGRLSRGRSYARKYKAPCEHHTESRSRFRH